MVVKETRRKKKKSKAVLSASRSRHLKLFSDAGMYVSSQEVVSLLKSQSSKPSRFLQKDALLEHNLSRSVLLPASASLQ